MKKRAAGTGRKQEETPVAMSVAMQQLMLPLLLAMDATKKGLLSFEQQMGMVAPSELLAKEAAMIAGPKGRHRGTDPPSPGAPAPRRWVLAAVMCRCHTRACEFAAKAGAPR